MLSDLTIEPVRVANFVLPGVAILFTCFRLWDRTRLSQLWWDDVWAVITMTLLIVFMTVVEVHLQDPSKHSTHEKVVVAYIIPEMFYSVNWSARMSILLTIIRISVRKLRTILRWVGVLFGFTWLILFAQIWWICVGNPKSWRADLLPQCPLGTSVAVAQVIKRMLIGTPHFSRDFVFSSIADVISDAILILAPIQLVWRTKLSHAQKIRITAIFSTTLITTAISLNHVYFVLRWGGLPEALAAIVQCNVSLIVANLSVIIAFLYRIHTEEEEELSVRTFNLGGVTNFLWRAQGQAPITSTFLTAGGVIRERKDVEKSRVIVETPAILKGPRPSSSDSVVNK